jgi:hypothetical protein
LETTIILDYRGSIRYETIGELIHNFKQSVPSLGIPVSIYKRLLLIMIESLENIMKHSECQPDPELTWLKMERCGTCYTITSSNLMQKENAESLKQRIDLLNSMDAQGVKEFYKSTITNGVFTKVGGAGLGLIEIAKISGNRINYNFESSGDSCMRFTQQIKVYEK